MYFFKKNHKQILDMRGTLVLSHNRDLVIARVKGAAPKAVRNAKSITDIPNLGFRKKLLATFAALAFIWLDNQAIQLVNSEADQDAAEREAP
jgi:hypothetical protein